MLFPFLILKKSGLSNMKLSKIIIVSYMILIFLLLANCKFNIENKQVRKVVKKNLNSSFKIITKKSLLNIKSISFDNLNLNEIPPIIADMKNLETLSIKNNNLKDIPEFINNLKKLREINLSNNKLEIIPDVIYKELGINTGNIFSDSSIIKIIKTV